MTDTTTHAIDISVQTRFLPDQSKPDDERYVFAYTITLHNTGTTAAQLIRRHWIITDAHGRIEEVRGDGVLGEQPRLRPGDHYQYTSGAVLETSVGTMHGSYEMLTDEGTAFQAQIPAFTLSIPRTLH